MASDSWKSSVEAGCLAGADRIEVTLRRVGDFSFRVLDDLKGGIRVGTVTQIVDGKARKVADVPGTIEAIESILDGYLTDQTEYSAFRLRCFKQDLDSGLEVYVPTGKTNFPIEGVKQRIREQESAIPSIQVLQTSMTFAAQSLKLSLESQKEATKVVLETSQEARAVMKEVAATLKSVVEVAKLATDESVKLRTENQELRKENDTLKESNTTGLFLSKLTENGGPAIPGAIGAVVRAIGKGVETGSFSEAGKELARGFADETTKLLAPIPASTDENQKSQNT